MLDNMIAKQTNKNEIIVKFRSSKANEIASYHQNGEGKMHKRKILPQGREVFKSDIMKKIVATLQRAINKAIK